MLDLFPAFCENNTAYVRELFVNSRKIYKTFFRIIALTTVTDSSTDHMKKFRISFI